MTKETKGQSPPQADERTYTLKEKILAAKIRVDVDEVRGVETPEWIRALAAQNVDWPPRPTHPTSGSTGVP